MSHDKDNVIFFMFFGDVIQKTFHSPAGIFITFTVRERTGYMLRTGLFYFFRFYLRHVAIIAFPQTGVADNRHVPARKSDFRSFIRALQVGTINGDHRNVRIPPPQLFCLFQTYHRKSNVVMPRRKTRFVIQ